MEGGIGAHPQGVAIVVQRTAQRVCWCGTSVMIAGLKICECRLGGLVQSKTYTCQEIIILENLVVLVLCNLWILVMLLKLSMKWMVMFSLVGS